MGAVIGMEMSLCHSSSSTTTGMLVCLEGSHNVVRRVLLLAWRLDQRLERCACM